MSDLKFKCSEMLEENQEKIPHAKIKRLVRLLGQSKGKDIRVSKEAIIGFSEATIKVIETIMKESMKGKDKGKVIKDTDILSCFNKYTKYEFLGVMADIEKGAGNETNVFQNDNL